jgi:glucokinase
MGEPVLGVDVGGTNIRAALVDRETGAVRAVEGRALEGRSPAEVVAAASRAIAAVAGRHGGAPFRRIGVGIAGQVLGKSGVVLNAPNLGWRDVPFGAMLGRELGVPVRVVNDLSAAAWGESRFGAARGVSDVLVVFVGTGVGSGIVVGGRLHEGARGVAGELGHVKVRPPRPGEPARPCGCGSSGCLEAYAGGANLAARVRSEVAAGAPTQILDLVGGDVSRITTAHVEEACAAGDGYARRLWDEVGELLATAVANAVTLLNPERLVLGGGVLRGSPTLREIVESRLPAAASPTAAAELTIAAAARGDEAGVVGAALLGSEGEA